MSKRRITCPETISVTKGGSTREFPFSAFVVQALCRDRRWGQTSERAYLQKEIKDAFGDIQPGEFRDLRESDWSLLRDCATQPQYDPLKDGTFTSYDPETVSYVLPYIEAVVEAKKAPAHPAETE